MHHSKTITKPDKPYPYSSLRVFARVEPQNDWRATWIIRYHSVQSSSKKSRPRHTPTPPTT